MLGYGNFEEEVDFLVRRCSNTVDVTVADEIFQFLFNSVYGSNASIDNFETQENVFVADVWLNFLHIFSGEIDDHLSTVLDSNPSCNYYRILSYNKFFVDHYRSKFYTNDFKLYHNIGQDEVEQICSFKLDALCCFDSFVDNDSTPNIEIYQGTKVSVFQLHAQDTSYFYESSFAFLYALCLFSEKHHLYKKDLFTGVLPSTQFGDVSVVSSTDTLQKIINLNASGNQSSQNAIVAVDGSLRAQPVVTGVSDDLWKLSPATAFSILDLRRSQALQRYNERLLRAGDDIKSVFKAHGWNGPSSAHLENSLFLGSFDGNFDINVVASTTQTSEVELGQLGSNGVATIRGKKIYFDASDFGVIMVVMHTTKAAEYNSFGIDPQTQLIERFDFPFPEFQSISLQPVSEVSYNMSLKLQSSDLGNKTPLVFNRVIGYLPTSFHYKTAIDKVHGLFYSTPYRQGAFSNWVVPKFHFDTFSEEFLYCDIRAIDNIFQQQSDGSSYTDKFFVNFFADIKCVLPLPVIGLPD